MQENSYGKRHAAPAAPGMIGGERGSSSAGLEREPRRGTVAALSTAFFAWAPERLWGTAPGSRPCSPRSSSPKRSSACWSRTSCRIREFRSREIVYSPLDRADSVPSSWVAGRVRLLSVTAEGKRRSLP